ncbi:MAG: hypothetical protein HKN19_01490 [Halioglobus sp.]|nr:hypothetical protein [Halioglobus sp.]
MTLFEYITVVVSMVLALTVVRGLDAIGRVYTAKYRYNIHVAWFSLKLFQPLLMWWSMWGLKGVTGWNFLAFVIVVAGPTLLYLQMATLVPRDLTMDSDWRGHFYTVRRRFFLTNIGLALTAPLQILATGALASGWPLFLAAGGEIVLSLIAMRSNNHRVQQLVVILVGSGFALWSLLLFRPLGFDGG